MQKTHFFDTISKCTSHMFRTPMDVEHDRDNRDDTW